MTRYRFDRGDNFVVSDFLGGTGESRIALIHEDGEVAVGVAAQCADKVAAFGVVERSKVHGYPP